MQDEQYIIDRLDANDWSEDKKQEIVLEATMRIGESLLEGLDEQKTNEYKAIVDDNHDVINVWLDQNVPDYKDNPVYQEIEAGYEADPEKNNPAKLFSTIAWVQLNVPDLQDRIDSVLEQYRQELAST